MSAAPMVELPQWSPPLTGGNIVPFCRTIFMVPVWPQWSPPVTDGNT